MIYLYPVKDTFSIFYEKPNNLEGIIEVESLPEGEGVLRRRENGEFYYETTSAPQPDLDQPIEPTEPIEPIQPVETIEEKLERIDETTAYNQLQTEYLVILAEFDAM